MDSGLVNPGRIVAAKAWATDGARPCRGSSSAVPAPTESVNRETLLLDEITRKMNSGLDTSEILDFVFESFETLVPYERISFSRIEDEGSTVRVYWTRTKSNKSRLGIGYAAPLANSSLEKTAQSGVPRILNDLKAYLRANPQSDSTRLMVEEGMRSSLTCPLIAKGKPVGFLFFSTTRQHAYQAEHVERFMRVARQLAINVEKGRCYEEIAHSHARLAKLMDAMLPPVIQRRLEMGHGLVADSFEDVTVLFADLAGFSKWSLQMSPEKVVALLNRIFSRFDRLVARYGLQKVGTQGDSYLAVAGAPLEHPNHTTATASLALAMQRTLANLRQRENLPIAARLGLHAGPVVGGVIGRSVYRYDVWGQTVNFASRLESTGEPGSIQVSELVYKRLHPHFVFQERGLVELKGFGSQRTYWLRGRDKSNRQPVSGQSRARQTFETNPLSSASTRST